MRKPALTLLCWLALSAAAPPLPYDMAAIPDAAAARAKALAACQAKTFATLKAGVDCALAAHRVYAMTEHLRDMTAFDAYAKAARQAAADADAGKLTPQAAQAQITAARNAYQQAVQNGFDAWRKTQAQSGPPFDRAALAPALKIRDAQLSACGPWTDPSSLNARIACALAADKAVTTAIHLRDMHLFYGYASFLKTDAVEAELGRRTPAQLEQRHRILWADFLQTLEQDYMGRGK